MYSNDPFNQRRRRYALSAWNSAAQFLANIGIAAYSSQPQRVAEADWWRCECKACRKSRHNLIANRL